MANEIQIIGTASGLTVKAVLQTAANQFWNGSAFETPALANWATYGIATTAVTDTPLYRASMPAVSSGWYRVLGYELAGSSLAVGDDLVWDDGWRYWTGTTWATYLPSDMRQLNGLLTDGTGGTRPTLELAQLRCICAVDGEGALHLVNVGNEGGGSGSGLYAQGAMIGINATGAFGMIVEGTADAGLIIAAEATGAAQRAIELMCSSGVGIDFIDCANDIGRSPSANGAFARIDTIHERLTAARAAKIDNLDATITSRLASDAYTAPPSASTIAAAVWAALASGLTTAGSIGKWLLDQIAAVAAKTGLVGSNDADSPAAKTAQATIAANLDGKVSEAAATPPAITVDITEVRGG